MQTYSFAPPNMGLDNKKNYVFVDEHNRHKRLKVMRACEGCRRRKIKCDAATTNAWPCAACVRLKLHCVPPTVNYDRSHSTPSHVSGLEGVLDFDTSSHSGDEDYRHQPATSAPQGFNLNNPSGVVHPPNSFSDGLHVFQTPPYSERAWSQESYSYGQVPGLGESVQEPYQFGPSNVVSLAPVEGVPSWSTEQYSVADLSSVLGELKIDEDGVAPYISQQKKTLAEAPALEEFEFRLPSIATGSGSTVRIPPELMPSEEQCTEWFDTFFTHIHPYVPVISKPYFYTQWRTNRWSISPLILEAIFACAGRMSDDPARGLQWLALASKHENCFMDVPRLSTIQALLLLLKAREATPKRGYYYRSWMTIKTIVTMAKDLELHEHFAQHEAGRSCGSDPTECLIKTRIWQCTFACEIMVGGPQGRQDYGVEPETVDLTIQRPAPGLDASDYQVSRQFTYLVRMVRHVRVLNDMYRKLYPRKDWGTDPEIATLNPPTTLWLNDIPSDLKPTFPDEYASPWLPSHFVGNMHCYYHLLVIMLHRPQLMSSSSFSAGGSWKQHMALCYDSAKLMCRLQEGIHETFGLTGFLCMLRGINFVIYAVLTCTMIHLVAITSPDPDFHTDAKDYFTRHMRILELCISEWPMADMQLQIEALREAFSADTSRPFELRPGFPYGSPGMHQKRSPPLDIKYQQPPLVRQTSHEQTAPIDYLPEPITPPISVAHDDQEKTSIPTTLNMISSSPAAPISIASEAIGMDQASWNPTRIFDQWNTAFGTPASMIGANTSTFPQHSPPLYQAPSTGSHLQPPSTNVIPQRPHQPYSVTSHPVSIPHAPSATTHASYQSIDPLFVTSSMWRDTVASTYDPNGLKRRWDVESAFMVDPGQQKRCK